MIIIGSPFWGRSRGKSTARVETITYRASLNLASSLNIPKKKWDNLSLVQEISLRNPESEKDF